MEFNEKLCRLCLSQQNVKVKIFNDQNPYSGIFRKVALLLPIAVSLDDMLPKKICYSCSTKLDLFYKFYNSTISAEKQLNNWLKSTLASSEFDSINVIKAELDEIEEIAEIECITDSSNVIGNVIKTEEEIQPHEILTTNSTRSRPLRKAAILSKSYKETVIQITDQIDQSDKDSKRIKTIEPDDFQSDNHQKPKTSNVPSILKVRTVSKQLRTRKTTSNSNEQTKTKGKVRRQFERQQNIVICDVCNSQFDNTEALVLHSIKHNDDHMYTCPVCQHQALLKNAILKHIRGHYGERKFKCEVCEKSFNRKVYASEHKYVHSGEKPFQCEVCGKGFTFSRTLSIHRNNQHSERVNGTLKKIWNCTICNKQYTTDRTLRFHIMHQHPEPEASKSVMCETCGKWIASKDKLRLHMRIHTGDKSFVCDICSRGFARRQHLENHKRTHTGEKPFVCAICGRRFTHYASLYCHRRRHSGERLYGCKLCDKRFFTPSSMQKHLLTCEPK